MRLVRSPSEVGGLCWSELEVLADWWGVAFGCYREGWWRGLPCSEDAGRPAGGSENKALSGLARRVGLPSLLPGSEEGGAGPNRPGWPEGSGARARM